MMKLKKRQIIALLLTLMTLIGACVFTSCDCGGDKNETEASLPADGNVIP